MAATQSATPNLDAVVADSPREVVEDRPPVGVYRKKGEAGGPQLRISLGERWSTIVIAVKRGETTWKEFVEGLSEEELARGQLKDSNGGFQGRPPALVPREFHLACQREMKRRFEEIFSADVLEIAKQYVQLAKDSRIPPKERAKMMQYAMERIFGGIPREIQLTQEKAWETVLVNVTADETSSEMPDWRARRYAGYAERTGEALEDQPDQSSS